MNNDDELMRIEHDACMAVNKEHFGIHAQWRRKFAALILERAAAGFEKDGGEYLASECADIIRAMKPDTNGDG